MQVNSIQTVFQNEENRTKAKYIGAGTLLSAGSAFLATKASKNAQDTFKMSNRIAKTAAAGVIAAGVMTLLTLKKDDFVAIKDKAMIRRDFYFVEKGNMGFVNPEINIEGKEQEIPYIYKQNYRQQQQQNNSPKYSNTPSDYVPYSDIPEAQIPQLNQGSPELLTR